MTFTNGSGAQLGGLPSRPPSGQVGHTFLETRGHAPDIDGMTLLFLRSRPDLGM